MKKKKSLAGKAAGKVGSRLLKTAGRLLWWLLKAVGIAYVILFIVFYFDLDGKLLYTVVEPNLNEHYSRMERKDNTKTPYEMKDPVL